MANGEIVGDRSVLRRALEPAAAGSMSPYEKVYRLYA
jgi:hypothetical protein